MDEQVVLVLWIDLLNPLASFLAEVVVDHHLCVLQVNLGVPHLPDGYGPPVEEPFNSVSLVLEIQFRPCAIF